MKKKFISAMLFGALLLASTSAVVSCKDYDDDISSLRTEITTNATDLTSLVNEKVSNLTNEISTLKSQQSALETAYKAADDKLQEAITSATSYADIQAAAAEKAAIEASQKALDDAIAKMETAIKDANAAISDVDSKYETKVSALLDADKTLQAAIDEANGKITTAQEKADAAYVLASTNTEALSAVSENLKKVETDLNSQIQLVKTDLQKEIAAQKAEVEGQIDIINSTLASNKSAIEALQGADADLLKKINANSEELASIGKTLAGVDAKLEANLSSAKAYTDAQIAALKAELGEDIAGCEAEIVAANLVIAENSKSIENLGKTKADKADVQEAVDKLQKQIDANQETYLAYVASTAELLNTIQGGVKTNSQSIKTLQGLIDELQTKVKQIDVNKESISDLSTKVTEYITSNDVALKELTDFIGTTATGDQTLISRIQELEKYVALLKSGDDGISVSEQVAANKADIEALYKALDEAFGTIDEGESDTPTAYTLRTAAANKFATYIQNIKDQLDDLNNQVEGLTERMESQELAFTQFNNLVTDAISASSTMITNVSLYKELNEKYTDIYIKQQFVTVKEKSATFPSSDLASFVDGTFSFTKDATKTLATETEDFVVRVSPVNADLSQHAANIHFVDAQGANLDDYIIVENVEAYKTNYTGNEVVTRAASEKNGLWKITLKLKDGYNASNFEKATVIEKDNKKYYNLFAVAIKNTSDDVIDSERYAISEYGVEFDGGTFTALSDNVTASNNMEVMGNDGSYTKIAEVFNRATGITVGATNDGLPKEYVWKDGTEAIPTPAVAMINDGSANVNVKEGDIRSSKAVLPVELNKDIKIRVGYDSSTKTYKAIKGFFVVLDEKRAIDDNASAGSELNAWCSYSYTNVGHSVGYNAEKEVAVKATLQEGNLGSIQVNSKTALGDIIGFRVYAVNLDGTLVDPDGQSFYVMVGDPATFGTANVSITANAVSVTSTKDGNGFVTTSGKLYTSADAASRTQISSTANLVWKGDDNNPKVGTTAAPSFPTATYYAKDGSVTTDLSKIATIQLSVSNVAEFIDDASYSWTSKIYDTNGILVKTLKVTLTKNMPTTQAALTFFDNVATGEYAFEPLLVNPDAASERVDDKFKVTLNADGTLAPISEGSFDLNNVFTNITADNTFTFVGSKWDSSKSKDVDQSYTGVARPTALNITVEKRYVNETRSMTRGIKYTGVSTKKNSDGTWTEGGNFTSESKTSYSVKYRTWITSMETSLARSYTPSATWTSKKNGTGGIDLTKVKVTNTKPDCLNLQGTLYEMNKVYLLIGDISVSGNQYDAVLSSDGKTIELAQKQATQLSESEFDVVVSFKCYDMFGFSVTKSLTVHVTAKQDTTR